MTTPQRAPLSYITAYLQFTVAVLFMVGYFGFIALLFFGKAKISQDLIELGKTLAVGLSGALGLLFAFLFLRSRIDSPPDPATTRTRQTIETETLPTAGAARLDLKPPVTDAPPSPQVKP
jgi:hypothetical protein